MKAQVYREMSTDELESKVQELQRHVFDLRSQATTEKLQDCRAAINARREVARIKTVLRQRQIEAQTAVKAGGKE
jgi:large subunit ribosomal protein L29